MANDLLMTDFGTTKSNEEVFEATRKKGITETTYNPLRSVPSTFPEYTGHECLMDVSEKFNRICKAH